MRPGYARAVARQEELRGRVVTECRFDAVETVAGVDVGIQGDRARAAVVVLELRTLEVVESFEVGERPWG
ncbi:MAG: endonuclease V, partial [Planctomycetota bacterium]